MAGICVVIPAYNEAATIAEVAAAACRVADAVIVIDDGSTDATGACVAALPVTLIRHEENRGKGASLWEGMQRAVADGADAVITIDGDGQHPAAAVPRLVAAHRRNPDRVIIAARLARRERMPKARRFGNDVADFWISWAAGTPIRDTQSGFRLYPAALIRRLDLAPDRRGSFVFESEILIEAARQGLPPMAVTIEAIYAAGARPSYYRPWLDTVRIVRMVAVKLLARGMYISGLLRSQRTEMPIDG